MKLSEIGEAQRADGVDFIQNEIKRVITDFGDRDPGSEGERKALSYMSDTLTQLGADVKTESFKVAPHAFFGWTYFVSIFMTLAIPIYFLAPVMSIVCAIIAVVPLILQFVFYLPALDWMFYKGESGNVLGAYKPEGEVKRRVVINGHSDAVYEWHWHYVGGYAMFLGSIIVVIVGLLYILATAVSAIVLCGPIGMPSGGLIWAGVASCAFIPFFIAFWFFADTRKVVPGANDNLTACYMAIAAIKTMRDNDIKLQNTEVAALITGSEEAGLRGAKAFVKNNPDYAREQDVETVFLTYETLRELEYLGIYNRDLNGTVRNDAQACALYKRVALKHGMDLPYGSVYAGATDAAAFSKGGYKAVSVAAMNPSVQKYYHTRLDNYDNLSPECLAKVFDITMDFIDTFDKHGFDIPESEAEQAQAAAADADVSDEMPAVEE